MTDRRNNKSVNSGATSGDPNQMTDRQKKSYTMLGVCAVASSSSSSPPQSSD